VIDRKKRVAFNATVLNPRSGGLGRYIEKLLGYFLTTDLSFDPIIYVSREFFHDFSSYTPGEKLIPLNISSRNPRKRIISEWITWPAILNEYEIDLFFSPMSYIPYGVKRPAVVTIHDLRVFRYPGAYGWLRGTYLKQKISDTIEKAVHIFAISQYTKRDILELFSLDCSAITVIYEGLDRERFNSGGSPDHIRLLRSKYRLPAKYILTVGHLEPRKNYTRLLEAFRVLKTVYGIEHSLVIIGRESWKFREIYETAERLKLKDHVLFTGFVDDDDLAEIYRQAVLFVAPSLYEGFGFTPLESMSVGTPVVAANATSYPEIVGDAAVLTDPLDCEDMAAQIHRVLDDTALRHKLIRNGFENIRRFDWHSCCEQTAAEIERILGRLS
jgi:glycosyltransferase involved in cell wall biosynthesis